jgi:hypothetical protein
MRICQPVILSLFIRYMKLAPGGKVVKRQDYEVVSESSAGVPPAVRRASRPPIGPAGGRRATEPHVRLVIEVQSLV